MTPRHGALAPGLRGPVERRRGCTAVEQDVLEISARLIHFGHEPGFEGTLAACFGRWHRMTRAARAACVIALDQPVGNKFILENADIEKLAASIVIGPQKPPSPAGRWIN
ncbi:MAG TPA: hypothetical protein VHC40_05175 [Rhizomicrobium sp.]|nr:hypothetical protein [Rhizomicrobium sp.]